MISKPRIIYIISGFAILSLLLWRIADGSWVSSAPNAVIPEITIDKFTLDNGLTVIIHEDHRSPLVAINIWYHVGSKDEKPDKHGLAHLCEHLMFSGAEHLNQDLLKVIEGLGATNYNGTTDRDRTRFFMDVPPSALDTALWLESDRMGYSHGAITQKKLDQARIEVEEESQAAGNREKIGDRKSPYDFVEVFLASRTFPSGHNYSWHPLRSIEGLKSISLADVKEWFRNYYCPSNAVLVLAGDIDTPTTRDKVKKYFAFLQPGKALNRELASLPRPYHLRRQSIVAAVSSPRIYKVWNVPGYADPDVDYLDLLRHVLNSRLQARLIDQERLGTSVSVSLKSYELCGQFQIEATASAGADLAVIERIIDQQLDELLAQGPTTKELELIKTELLSSFLSDIEQIGGSGGKSDILAISEVFAGDPHHYKKANQRLQAAGPEAVKAIGSRWLSDCAFVLYIKKLPEYKASSVDVDRSSAPGISRSNP